MIKLPGGDTSHGSAPSTGAEEPWLQGCRDGDPDALAHLFRTHRPVVDRLLFRLVGPTPDIEDLVQSTFVEVFKNLHRFRGEAKLGTWICGIAVHIANHHMRAGKLRRYVPLELVSEDGLDLAGATIDPRQVADQTIDRRRLAIKLHTLLDQIRPKKRIALMLYVMEEKSVEEIAALMKATQTATRSRMYFARRELRKLILSDPSLGDWAALFFKRGGAGSA